MDIKSMFDSIKESLNTEKQPNVSFRNFLRTEANKTYLVRLLPNIKDPKSTFYHYMHHGFKSLATNQYVDAFCPRSIGERCPICEARIKLYKTKKEDDKVLAGIIRTHEKHLVNVYVISDPTTPENEGTVKVLRFGKNIYEKILSATEGDDASEFGTKIYDLTENGCNLKIKVETTSEGKREFTNYNNSRFTAPGAIPNMDANKIKSVYENIMDLPSLIETKTTDELEDVLRNHVFTDGAPTVEAKKETQTETVKEQPKSQPAKGKPTDKKIEDLLAGLDNM